PDDIERTYAQLRALSNRVSNLLRREADIGPDDVVVTVMSDHHVHVAVLFAVWRLGAVFCGLNRQLPREQLVDDAKRTRARVVILDERTAHLGADFLDAGFEVFCAGRGDGGISDLL